MKRTCWFGVMASFMCIGLAISWICSSGAQAEEYNLGVALGLTGSGSSYSADGVKGITLAVDEINAKGGLLGKYRIKLSVRDTQTKPEVGVKEAKDLILREKVRSILGPWSSAVALGVEEICYENRVLHLMFISNSEAMTTQNYSPYTFNTMCNTYMNSKSQVLYLRSLAKQKNWRKYVTIVSDYEWGHAMQGNFVPQLREAVPEMQLAKEYWPRLGETDFTSYITAILKDAPNFVYGNIADKDHMAFLKQAKPYGLFSKAAYTSLVSVTELKTLAKEIPRGIIGTTRCAFFFHMEIPAMQSFVKNFLQKHGEYPSDWAVGGYDSVYILKQGIEKAGTIESERVKAAMKGMTVNITRGKLYFRSIDNQINGPSYFGIVADDPAYPFPIYHDQVMISGEDSFRPEKEIPDIRRKAGLYQKRRPEDIPDK